MCRGGSKSDRIRYFRDQLQFPSTQLCILALASEKTLQSISFTFELRTSKSPIISFLPDLLQLGFKFLHPVHSSLPTPPRREGVEFPLFYP